MSALSVLIRNGLYEAIDQRRKDHDFSINEIQVRKAYRPTINFEELTIPLVTVVYLNSDEARSLRSFDKEKEFYIQFALQARANPDIVEDGDNLLLFHEQLFDTAASDTLVEDKEFSWQRTEAIKDENGLPYNLNLLREKHTFEMVATAVYKSIKEEEED